MVGESKEGKPTNGPGGPEVERHPVIGIVVIRMLQSDGKKVLNVQYLVPGSDGNVASEFNIGRQDDVVAVLPAPPNSYRVQRGPKILGYEFGSASHPDWEKVR
ncbi:MAG TPA: hypothetical protein VMS79_03130 [Methanomassiliicoccales archaeon]|nr:hypothetical protein [Methanomassiliicoccales archaeon]